MRFSVVETIYEAALKDPKICFIQGDLGHAKTEEFRKNLPDRYYNGGMAEQNIIGMAAGLALSGMKVFVYSIVPFITLRCFEQIKVDVCSHNADVTIIGVGGGIAAYSTSGATHVSIEEVAAFRALPNMKIICPANPSETVVLTKEVIKEGGPAYLRIGRGKEVDYPVLYKPQIGKAGILKTGSDISIVTSGTIAIEALEASALLEKNGISAEVINMHTIKPLDAEIIRDRIKKMKAIFTLEEHNIIGGLGGAVAEVIAEEGDGIKFHRFGINDAWPEVVGDSSYLRDYVGLSGKKVAESIIKLI